MLSNNENDLLIQVDMMDQVLGNINKKEAHLVKKIQTGVIHRAFSLFLFDSKKRLLVQQRAASKITFPLYYSNTCCSHPLYKKKEMEVEHDLGIKRAARRRLYQELGIAEHTIALNELHVVNKFWYQAMSDDVWGEQEIDYIVLLKLKKINPIINKNEVKDITYLSEHEVPSFCEKNIVTPWFKIIYKKYNLWNVL